MSQRCNSKVEQHGNPQITVHVCPRCGYRCGGLPLTRCVNGHVGCGTCIGGPGGCCKVKS